MSPCGVHTRVPRSWQRHLSHDCARYSMYKSVLIVFDQDYSTRMRRPTLMMSTDISMHTSPELLVNLTIATLWFGRRVRNCLTHSAVPRTFLNNMRECTLRTRCTVEAAHSNPCSTATAGINPCILRAVPRNQCIPRSFAPETS